MVYQGIDASMTESPAWDTEKLPFSHLDLPHMITTLVFALGQEYEQIHRETRKAANPALSWVSNMTAWVQNTLAWAFSRHDPNPARARYSAEHRSIQDPMYCLVSTLR